MVDDFTWKKGINETLAGDVAGWRALFRNVPMTDAPVDLDHLARYTGGDKSLNAEILRLFDGQISEMVDQLQAILEQQDQKRWRQVTHTIKGAARGVGAFAMGQAAADAEPVDPLGHPDEAGQALKILRSRGQAVQAFIANYLAA